LTIIEPDGAGLDAAYHGTGARKLAIPPSHEGPSMRFGFNGIWGLLVLAADIWAIIHISQSSASNVKKLLWILAVILLPIAGMILWFFLGPRGGRA
jgi:drug/metabolite transporter (DMT)-like permease